ncbi:MAG: hypothetical protein AAGG09_14595 [Pseudomonadota bacterium]
MTERETEAGQGRGTTPGEGTAAAEDTRLDLAFAAARAEASDTAPLSASFADRLLADAHAAQPRHASAVQRSVAEAVGQVQVGALEAQGPELSAARPAAPLPFASWLRALQTMLRGPRPVWPVAAGLAGCALAGVWIGYAPPASLQGMTDLVRAEIGIPGRFGAEATDELLLAFDLGGLDG